MNTEQIFKPNVCTVDLLKALYMNIKASADTCIGLIEHSSSDKLRDELMRALNGYERFANDIEYMLRFSGKEAKEEGFLSKLTAKIGMSVSIMSDSSEHHIAHLMIEQATSDIAENIKLIHKYEAQHCSKKALSIAQSINKFLEDTIERIKTHL